ncbi:MAG: Integrase catalytic region [Berkelbacteria bacterium GW2011_GWA2_38_9]|uniref:Integrase catalytic region n=1 Tax=Berkelbacteria bacterium GW2011_GWA2_38_9 TaxID=1618334 RepID=A0A0G0NNI1_9BACT|nr:MAG: Integrase catalytic region [Berkelbacteria bacterium GW2011_GWA2_38_9]
MTELIKMSQKELSRYVIIKKCLDGQLDAPSAAKMVGVTSRQVRRMKSKVREFGVKGLIHGNRGRPSNRSMPIEIIGQAKYYLNKYYSDFKPTFASEKLLENHKIQLSSEKVRQMMAELNLWQIKPKKTNGEHRQWRPRKESFGEMEQFDGSYHRWFEYRGESCCLLASIDDATGKIVRAEFTDSESVVNVFKFWLGYINESGKPVGIYLDRYSTYANTHHKPTRHQNYQEDAEYLTQFQRAMGQLGINLITAHSPQAKGRAERLFSTLQDRLIKEMRLKGIDNVNEANEYLAKEFIPKFNQRFSVPALKKDNLHQKLTEQEQSQLSSIFSVHYQRQINNDFTVRFKNSWYQIVKDQPTLVYKKDKVQIEEHLNGEIKLSIKGHYLNCKVLPERPTPQRFRITELVNEVRAKNPCVPNANHPWRNTDWIFNKQYKNKDIKQKQMVEYLKLNQVKADISTLEKVGHF